MEALGLHKALVQTCRRLHIETLTPIQQKSIPSILKGHNFLGISETGSGKTLCYCLPILHGLSQECYGVYALILLPTQELALQVFEQLKVFSAPFGWEKEIAWIVGGDHWMKQSQDLSRRPYIVVATPGRLLQHLQIDEVCETFRHLRTLVLDEADYLLNETLGPQVEQILQCIGEKSQAQTLLFTATNSPVVLAFMERLQLTRNSETSPRGSFECVDTVSAKATPLDNLEHYYLFIPSQIKMVYMLDLLLTLLQDQTGMIFTKTCRTAQVITTLLELYGISVTTLHGLLDRPRRTAHLEKFRGNIATRLVSTDVAARGLDIPKVNFVLNYDLAKTLPSYLHRAGRTARVGRKGVCISLICEKDDTSVIQSIEATLGRPLEKLDIPESQVLTRLSEVTRKHQEAKQILSEAGFFERATAIRQAKLKKRRDALKSLRRDSNKRHLTPGVPRSKKGHPPTSVE